MMFSAIKNKINSEEVEIKNLFLNSVSHTIFHNKLNSDLATRNKIKTYH